jgi:hypothetical protein
LLTAYHLPFAGWLSPSCPAWDSFNTCSKCHILLLTESRLECLRKKNLVTD